MPPLDHQDLYMMVGEIRSDVKALLASHQNIDARVSRLEKRWWTAAGAAAMVATFATTALARVFGFHS